MLRATDQRAVSVEIVAPRFGRNLTVIVFSHGANAAPGRYRAIIDQWAHAGFVVASPLHIDSEDYPQRETANRDRVLQTRIADVDLVLTAIKERKMFGPALATRIARRPIVAAGHSYGAYIAQIAAGASVRAPGDGRLLTGVNRAMIGAVVALSPPPSVAGFNPPESWHALAVPMLVQTGTADILPVFAPRWQQHLDSFRAAPAGNAWAAVYTGVDHYFGGAICRLKSPPDAAQQGALDRFATLSIRFMKVSGNLSKSGARRALEHEVVRLSDRYATDAQ